MSREIFKKTGLPELNEAYRKVLYWFFSFPAKECSLSDLARLTKLSKSTAHTIVKQLSKEGFLRIDEIGKVWRISCNQEHHYNRTKKVAYNLELISAAGIVEVVLKNVENPQAIIAFGSYRKGDDTESSDIDIAVETLDDKEIQISDLGTIPVLGYRSKVTVRMLTFCRKKIDINLFTNIANGIVLFGLLEARP